MSFFNSFEFKAFNDLLRISGSEVGVRLFPTVAKAVFSVEKDSLSRTRYVSLKMH